MTLEDIAKKLGLSSSTVSRALDPVKAHLIAELTRRRIQIYASRVHYVPHRGAQDLARGQSRTIGVVLSTVFHSVFFNDYVAKVITGVYAALGKNKTFGCKLIVLPRPSNLSEVDAHVLRTGVDGLIISSIGDFAAEEFERLARRLAVGLKRPVVGLNMDCQPGQGLSVVTFSNRAAAQEAVTHLIQKGHRKIGMIWADNGSADLRARVAGYREALEKHQVPIHRAWSVQGDFLAEGGYQAALNVLKSKSSRPTALFCLNDEMAVGAIQAVKALRLRCPKDVAVMGFDGLDLGRFTDPPLTTVYQPVYEMSEAATQLLIDTLEERRQKPVRLTFCAKLVIRQSA